MFLYLSNKSRQRFCGVCFFFLFWMPPCPCLPVVTGTVICKINCQEKCLHVNPFLEQPAIFLLAWQPASHRQETRLPCLPFLKAWHNLWKLINWKSMAIRLRRVEAVSLFELTRTGAWKNKGWPKAAEIAAKQALSKRDTTVITENKCQARAGFATMHRNSLSGCTTIWGLHVTAEISSWKSGRDQGLFRELHHFNPHSLQRPWFISILNLFFPAQEIYWHEACRGRLSWMDTEAPALSFTRRGALRLKTRGFHRGNTRQIKDDIWHWDMCHYCKLTHRSTQTWGSWPGERHVTILNRDQQKSGDSYFSLTVGGLGNCTHVADCKLEPSLPH